MSKIEEQLGFLDTFFTADTLTNDEHFHITHRILLMIKSKDLLIKFINPKILKTLIELNFISCNEYGLHVEELGEKFINHRNN
ncbi:hypothetical protein Phi12:1_gp20 [Cellulophaga phage phi12:1]|uniref:Uncharacterized protein n=2 Tax=Cellulophaga phage phi12:1 TaxID=1327976 RepID=R9ZXX0_9CAUD|nr:hypothetical protein Phi12:1_gp20 [Cellulophaga phage phi12:1]AGO47986.1 hypothetical protein Phi12:1_gp20 [Cellulophaga phage phi12:1]AGO48151.1 hypothetical protein Phi12:3_gp20 [Cellulophaga phage phi12:3]